MNTNLKIVNLGLPKSGTTSLAKALKLAGMKVADWKIRSGQAKFQGFVGQLMYQSYFEGRDPLALMPEFDAFTEINIIAHGLNMWPQFDWGLISTIRAHHHGVKFVLTTRDAALQSDSIERWFDLGTTRLPKHAIPALPEGYGASHADRIRWINGHAEFCRQIFAGAKDFLEVPVADPDVKRRIEVFTGLTLPWWGTANANSNRDGEEGGPQ